MGGIEELPDESGACPKCGKVATTKCTGCKQVGRILATIRKEAYPTCNTRCTTATVTARRLIGSCTSQSARRCPTRLDPLQSSATSWLPTRILSRARYVIHLSNKMFVACSNTLLFLQLILTEAPLVIGPSQMTIPVCLLCYNPVDGSYK